MTGERARSRCGVVAIDGPAASGKSSTARMVAQALGYRHVDSGSLYRAMTAMQLRHAADPDRWTEPDVLSLASSVTLAPVTGGFTPLLDDRPADDEIRGAAVTAQVSRVAQMPRVREWVNARVRETAQHHDVVVDGRDIGTTVFPDAPLKIYLVADPWERARRRLIQTFGRSPTEEEIAEETDRLVHRDAKDALQSAPAADAVLIDTTHLTQAQQVERIVALAHAVESRAEGGGWSEER